MRFGGDVVVEYHDRAGQAELVQSSAVPSEQTLWWMRSSAAPWRYIADYARLDRR
ncbi:hypothetical protein [Mycobacterium sp. OAE908]|uniref:hypothetical protein n=1 Tax=Mycobacterium sp. OAE908 TaxID=2817899 RepID=UPI001AE465CA